MRIAIISGGKYKSETSHNAASHLYDKLHDRVTNLHMVRVDSNGDWKSLGLKTNMYKVLPQVDHVIDLRHDKKSVEEVKLIKMLKLLEHVTDNYENDFVKKLCYQLDINHPRYFMIRREETNIQSVMHDMWRRVHLPIRILPNSYNNTSLYTYEYNEAINHIKYLQSKGEDVVIEELQDKHILRIVSIRNLRGKNVYMTLPHILNNRKNVKLDQIVDESHMKELENILTKLYKVLDHKILAVEFTIHANKIQISAISTKLDLSESGIDHKLISDLGVTFEEILKAAS